MTSPACGSCTAPVNDGYLCTGCTRDLAEQLLIAASIAGDLDDAVARLLKRGSGGRSSSPEPPLPVDLGASSAAAELGVILRFWSVDLGGQIATIASMAKWLAAHLAQARQHPHAPRMLAEVRRAVSGALAVIDHQPERAPAGQCEACGQQLLAELGADEVRCGCGQLTTALQDKRRQRAAAADVLGTAAEIHGALKAIGINIPRGTITSWASRQRLLPRPGGAYALSDVLALHAQSQQPRPKVRG